LFIRNTALLTCPETPEIDVTSTHASTSTRHHTMSAFATLRAPVVVKTGKASAFARGSSAALPVRARSPSSRRRYPSGLFSDAARGGLFYRDDARVASRRVVRPSRVVRARSRRRRRPRPRARRLRLRLRRGRTRPSLTSLPSTSLSRSLSRVRRHRARRPPSSARPPSSSPPAAAARCRSRRKRAPRARARTGSPSPVGSPTQSSRARTASCGSAKGAATSTTDRSGSGRRNLAAPRAASGDSRSRRGERCRSRSGRSSA